MLSKILSITEQNSAEYSLPSHPWVLKDPAELFTELLFIIYESFQRMGEVSVDWRKASITPVFRKGKEDSGNYSPVNLTSASGKEM